MYNEIGKELDRLEGIDKEPESSNPSESQSEALLLWYSFVKEGQWKINFHCLLPTFFHNIVPGHIINRFNHSN